MPQSSVQISGRHSATWRDALGGAGHVGAVSIQRQGLFDIAEDQVAAHAGRQVEHDIDIGGADEVGDFLVEIVAAARRAGLGIAHMAMDDGGTGLGGIDGRGGDLLGRARHMRRLAGGVAGAGHGTGDEDVAVHAERHGCLPLFLGCITIQDPFSCFAFSDFRYTLSALTMESSTCLRRAKTPSISICWFCRRRTCILVASVIEPLRAANRISGRTLYTLADFSARTASRSKPRAAFRSPSVAPSGRKRRPTALRPVELQLAGPCERRI